MSVDGSISACASQLRTRESVHLGGPSRYALIIGAMKAGTTSLYDYLAEHPQIAACLTKEPYFLNDDTKYAGGVAAYSQLWSWDGSVQRVALEASTTYTKQPAEPDVASRLSAWKLSDVRFIYLVRHPLDRIDSQLLHEAGSWRGGDFDRAAVLKKAVAFSRYAWQLESYEKHFGCERLLVRRFEDMVKDPSGLVRDTYAFLGVDEQFMPRQLGQNKNDGGWWRSQIRPAFWHRLRAHRAYHLAKRLVPGELRQRMGGRAQSLMVARLKLSVSERKRIWAELAEDREHLRTRYGIHYDGPEQ
jgi:hypothetical protein